VDNDVTEDVPIEAPRPAAPAVGLTPSAYSEPSPANDNLWISCIGESNSAKSFPAGEIRNTSPDGSVPAKRFPLLSSASETMLVSFVSASTEALPAASIL